LNIYVTDEYGNWSLYNKIEHRKIDTIYISQEIKSKLLEDIATFINNESEYNKFGIPYKKTFLLTGIPGSGKTSLIKSICNYFNMNLSILSVQKNFDNSALLNSIKRIEDDTILLIEDVDSFFEKRTGVDAPSITFSQFINVLDGVLYKHGIITFLTTNHPDRLDNALLRIGRVDKIIRIDYPSKTNIRKLFFDMLKNGTNEGDLKDMFDDFYNCINDQKITMSAIVNFLFRYKLDWKKNLDELLLTNSFIKETMKEANENNLYS
jgi:chaperone BCS1